MLPLPTTLIYCPKCDDVKRLDHDRQGQYCSGCFRTLAHLQGMVATRD